MGMASLAEGFGSPCTCFAILTMQALASFHRAEHGVKHGPEKQRTEPQTCLGAEFGGGKGCLAGGWVNGLSDIPPIVRSRFGFVWLALCLRRINFLFSGRCDSRPLGPLEAPPVT